MGTIKDALLAGVSALNRTERNRAIASCEAAIGEVEQRLASIERERQAAIAKRSDTEERIEAVDAADVSYDELVGDLFRTRNDQDLHVTILDRKHRKATDELAELRAQLQRLHLMSHIHRHKKTIRDFGKVLAEMQTHIDALGVLHPQAHELREKIVAGWPIGKPPLIDDSLLTIRGLSFAIAVGQYKALGIEPLERGRYEWPQPRHANITNPARNATPDLGEFYQRAEEYLFRILDGPGGVVEPEPNDDPILAEPAA